MTTDAYGRRAVEQRSTESRIQCDPVVVYSVSYSSIFQRLGEVAKRLRHTPNGLGRWLLLD